MSIWTPLNTLIVVCLCAVVLSLCVGRVLIAVIDAKRGDTAGANASLDALEQLAQRAAEAAATKVLSRQTERPIINALPTAPADPQPKVQT